MKGMGKGWWIAVGVILVLAVICLCGGDAQAFVGGIVVAGIVLAVGSGKFKRKPKIKDIPSITSQRYTGGSTFGQWHPKVHHGAAQRDRFERSGHEYMELRAYNDETGFGEIYSSSDHTYITSLDDCSCPDFEKRSQPCKHIYFLARKMGYTDDEFYSVN